MQHCFLYSHVTNDMVAMDMTFSKYVFTTGWMKKEKKKDQSKNKHFAFKRSSIVIANRLIHIFLS